MAMGWVLILSLPGVYLLQRFTLGIDAQDIRCLPDDSRAYWIDHWAHQPQRGDRIAFRSDHRMLPFFNVNTLMVKQVAGLPGDLVVLENQQLKVNHITAAEGLLKGVLSQLQSDDWTSPRRLKIGEWVVVGRHPLSFDSRYWGVVDEAHLVGIAHAFPY